MTPFYEKARNLFLRTQDAQIQKGLLKYPEPFNPMSWTPQELLNHALEEAVDLTHYLVGLKEQLDAKDKEIEKYKNRCADYERKLNNNEVNNLPGPYTYVPVINEKDEYIKQLEQELRYLKSENGRLEGTIESDKRIKKLLSSEGTWNNKGRKSKLHAYFDTDDQ